MKHESFVDEVVLYSQEFSASGNWSIIQGDITPRYKNQALSAEKTMPMTLYVEFYATTLAGVLYLDDFQLTEAQ